MFSIVKNLVQGSEKWLQFRRKHIMATDAGKILQDVPISWGTPYSLWFDKIIGREKELTPAMLRGIELEPFARSAYEQLRNVELVPHVITSNLRPWQAASLDGITRDLNRCVEFKCGESAYNSAKQGKIKDYYISQLQHTMSVTGHDSMDYACYWNDDLIIINIDRDNEYIENLIKKEKEFYECLVNFKEPERGFLEYHKVYDEQAIFLKERLEASIEQKKELEDLIKEQKKALIKIANGKSIDIDGLKIKKCIRKGNIQYHNIHEINKVDLEEYRSEPTEYYQFRF
ncbi:MAG: YqaJ viral recombinase family protein [Sphaerochaetaceae bacterium]|nr:YqaJ viral recombinase family protein [Sphaerochaetaceae bacterium]